jgi:hypothetical protein
VLPDHGPEIVGGERQRSLAGNELLLSVVALKKRKIIKIMVV